MQIGRRKKKKEKRCNFKHFKDVPGKEKKKADERDTHHPGDPLWPTGISHLDKHLGLSIENVITLPVFGGK